MFDRKQYELPRALAVKVTDKTLQIAKSYPRLNPAVDFIFFLANTLYIPRFLVT